MKITEKPFSIPDHWRWIELKELAEINPAFDRDDLRDDDPVSFVGMKRVEELSGRIDLSETEPLSEVRKGYTYFEDGDVLFAKITPCMENGKVAVARGLENGVGFGSTEFHVIRHPEEATQEWIFHYLIQEGFRRDAKRAMTGSAGQKRVPTGYIEEVPIPLPPLPEQRRIVAKIEELFSNLDAGMTDLQTAGQQLERYRLSVLQAAVEGRLTADWRRTHDPVPAEQLLEGILEKRDNSSYLRKPSLEEFEEGVPSEIPDDWTWTRVGAVCYVRGGKAFRSKNYEDEGIPLVRISNIEDRKVSFEEDTVYLPPSFAEEHGRYLMKEGDIVIAMSGATTGKLGVFEGENDSALLNQRVGRFEFFDHDLISEDYFFYFLLTIQDDILKEAYGAAQPNISATAISNFALPLPPLQEQNLIASEVERLLSVADDAAATADREHTRAQRLRQSILKQAFSGQLVPHGDGEAPSLADVSTTAMDSSTDPAAASTTHDRSGGNLLGEVDEDKQIEMDL